MKIFDQAAARTGLRDDEATAAGFDPATVESNADDDKRYYPGSHRIRIRVTGDGPTGRLLGVQLFGHRPAEIAKRIETAATAIFHGMTVDALNDLGTSPTRHDWAAPGMLFGQPPATGLGLNATLLRGKARALLPICFALEPSVGSD